MGNCLCNHSSSRLVAPAPPTTCCELYHDKAAEPIEKENQKTTTTSSSSGRSKKKKEVTIKMTKRQLEELLCRVDVNELTVEQVLVQIMMNSNNADDEQISQRSWKPALQSIPE